jgi:hypothetical protein
MKGEITKVTLPFVRTNIPFTSDLLRPGGVDLDVWEMIPGVTRYAIEIASGHS